MMKLKLFGAFLPFIILSFKVSHIAANIELTKLLLLRVKEKELEPFLSHDYNLVNLFNVY